MPGRLHGDGIDKDKIISADADRPIGFQWLGLEQRQEERKKTEGGEGFHGHGFYVPKVRMADVSVGDLVHTKT